MAKERRKNSYTSVDAKITTHNSEKIRVLNSAELFFRAQAFEEALRKDRDCSAEKGTTKKGESRGEGERRPKEKHSPLPTKFQIIIGKSVSKSEASQWSIWFLGYGRGNGRGGAAAAARDAGLPRGSPAPRPRPRRGAFPARAAGRPEPRATFTRTPR